jgi:hypothetical protein
MGAFLNNATGYLSARFQRKVSLSMRNTIYIFGEKYT